MEVRFTLPKSNNVYLPLWIARNIKENTDITSKLPLSNFRHSNKHIEIAGELPLSADVKSLLIIEVGRPYRLRGLVLIGFAVAGIRVRPPEFYSKWADMV
jgi:hypothetical protein